MSWEELISLENIHRAWKNFFVGKQHKRDVVFFAHNIEFELYSLHNELRQGIYHHGGYERFKVYDPKERTIHKATVRDRVVHRMLYNYLLPIFNPRWLDCSFSCRPGFGQRRSIFTVERALFKISRNYTKIAWAVKCDIRRFFDSIDHEILYRLLCRSVADTNVRALLWKIICSFSTEGNRGIPIGNLTSQIFANTYLHGLDAFVKHQLKQPFYFRYADDFICLVDNKFAAEQFVNETRNWLARALSLELHPRKIVIRSTEWGIDWLGVVLFPGYRVLRPTTRRRIINNIQSAVRDGEDIETLQGTLASYAGLLQPVARKKIDENINQIVGLFTRL